MEGCALTLAGAPDGPEARQAGASPRRQGPVAVALAQHPRRRLGDPGVGHALALGGHDGRHFARRRRLREVGQGGGHVRAHHVVHLRGWFERFALATGTEVIDDRHL